jgi:hypothetical protein
MSVRQPVLEPEATIDYLDAVIALHRRFDIATACVPVLTGEQRAYLSDNGFAFGSYKECCWITVTQPK